MKTTISGIMSLIALSPLLLLCQKNQGNHNQNVTTNNGISVQVNVEQSLRKASKLADVDQRGWMRVLVPANETTPALPDKCQQYLAGTLRDSKKEIKTSEGLSIFHGDNNFARCTTAACTVVAGGSPSHNSNEVYPLLSVKRIGTVYILSTEIYDHDGNIVVDISEDRPHLNRNFISDWARPDKSTLIVTDNHNNRVLYVRLLNPKALYVEGVFNLPDKARSLNSNHMVITVAKDDLQVGGNKFACTNFGEASLAAIVFSDE